MMVQTLRRYLRLLRVQLRMSATTAMQYRTEFLLKGALALFWIAITLVPLTVVFSTTRRPSMFGWSYEQALVVLAWFTLLKAILEGGVTPSLLSVVEGVRNGALDFVLLKPVDSQFMVSTAKFEPWRVVDFLGAGAIFVYAFEKMGRWPQAIDLTKAALLLVVAVLLLYSIWILVVSAAFWVVRMDNLSYLFSSIFDAGRWPIQAFQSPLLRWIFTWIFPLALMTTFPAQALLGDLNGQNTGIALAGGVSFAVLARLVWTRAVRFYTSASS
jgi:ABC-2 type transport system permease protein